MCDLSFDSHKLEQIAFTLTTSLNQKARRRVLKKNIGPRTLPECSPVELDLLGFTSEEIQRIKNSYIPTAEQEVEKAQKNGVRIIFKGDDDYPAGLSEIHDPPDFIYAKGDTGILKSSKIAVVGSRKASQYGLACLNHILPDLCAAGISVVSGMAYGIDSMAHNITLKTDGKTIGVNAGGLLHLYPPGNVSLINQIIERGCVVSEFALDTVPRPFYFPIRNRIIAGISKAILVVEAALKSGSLITARLGLEQNRDIFAIPGRIDSPISEGPNFLIQQGAKMITSSKDILIEYGITPIEKPKKEDYEFSKSEEQILELMMDHEIKSVDFLVESLNISVSAIISVLMGLILKNVVAQEPGGYRLSVDLRHR